jgi:hypothetical protein
MREEREVSCRVVGLRGVWRDNGYEPTEVSEPTMHGGEIRRGYRRCEVNPRRSEVREKPKKKSKYGKKRE